MSAPRPRNWVPMCDAWDDAAEFARQVAIYYAQLGRDTTDITEPRHSRDDLNALSGD